MGEFAFLIDQVFAKIPAGFLAVPTISGRVGEPIVQRRLTFAFNRHFFKHGKGDMVIVLAKIRDFRSRAGFLPAKSLLGKPSTVTRSLFSE